MNAWLESSWLNAMMLDFQWAFPICEALHFVGLCILIGSIGMIDLRMLGFAPNLPARAIHQLLPWAWFGFGINAVTGLLFYVTNPEFYYTNPSFWIKMIIIAVLGANALWFELTMKSQLRALPEGADMPSQARTMASISIVLWVAVICFGRFIMYWPPI